MKLSKLHERKQVNTGNGSEFQKGTESNASGLSSAAAEHPGNTIIKPAPQKPAKFNAK